MMAHSQARDSTARMPSGIPYIIANEAAERFCFYGMRTILVIFMTRYLLDRHGRSAPMDQSEAMVYYHLFIFGVYFIPLFGSIIADAFLGKYRTIILLSIAYSVGCLALTLDQTRVGLLVGLSLIAIGSGGIKPCVSANVGDQFGPHNQHLLSKAFGWFYVAINFGSMFSTFLTPFLLEGHSDAIKAFLAERPNWWQTLRTLDPNIMLAFLEQRFCPSLTDMHGPGLAFGVPALAMILATGVFWMGRRRFVHVPPAGLALVRQTFSLAGLRQVGRVLPIFALMIPFNCLYDQSGSAWVLQAERMDRRFLGVEWFSSQVQVVNPILVLIFVPLFTYILYPAINRVFCLTDLRKIGLGLFLTAISFVIPAHVEALIAAGGQPNISWQFLAYVLLTAAEVLINVTCLEFAYTQAPAGSKSLVTALYLMSIALGNISTSVVNLVLDLLQQKAGLSLTGVYYYWLFVALMLVTAVVFIPVARSYRPIQLGVQGQGSCRCDD
ncbi:MAG: POT family MFS transporter [Sedimentisphaerales bacterium]|nr:POT family MFS transporter [Sedimentisphaerales bacterium]